MCILRSKACKEFPSIEHILLSFFSCKCAKTCLTVDYFRFFFYTVVVLVPLRFFSVHPFQNRKFFARRKTTNRSVFIVYKYIRLKFFFLVHECFASNSLIACQLEIKCEKFAPFYKRIGHKRRACWALVELLLFQFKNITRGQDVVEKNQRDIGVKKVC